MFKDCHEVTCFAFSYLHITPITVIYNNEAVEGLALQESIECTGLPIIGS